MVRLLMMKGDSFNPKRHMAAGRFMSEKLDGQRAFWDGGVSRGLITTEVPYGNTEKDKKATIATGLWSQNAKVIYAPAWFLDQLPPFPLDLELWAGRGNFQLGSSIVRSQDFSGDWTKITAMVIDIPDPRIILANGRINQPHYKKTLIGCDDWWIARGTAELPHIASTFRERLSWLDKHLVCSSNVQLHQQIPLPMSTPDAKKQLDKFMDEVLDQFGEGVILKSPSSFWMPERNDSTHKYKPHEDMEATVIGYTSGRETDKGSKLLGLMGALICRIPAGDFKVSGFKEHERVLSTRDFPEDVVLPVSVTSEFFPRGSTVTVMYRELTDSGIPKEARYHRKRPEE